MSILAKRIIRAGEIALIKSVVGGIVARYAQDWTIEHFRQCATDHADMSVLMSENPGIYAQIADKLAQFPELGNLSAADFVAWVGKGNPGLAGEIVSDQNVLGWLVDTWREERSKLLQRYLT